MTTDNVRDYHWNNWCQRKNNYSQHGEELVIEYFFKYLPISYTVTDFQKQSM